ncbi:MAG TPA: hypothetical protein VLZ84_04300 [Asticcacaulis sp.]|nr:hypothetical protein [Asticcacaulis sp.]
MPNLTPKILAYANHITAKVADGRLSPENAADDIAELVRAALEGDNNFESLLDLVET